MTCAVIWNTMTPPPGLRHTCASLLSFSHNRVRWCMSRWVSSGLHSHSCSAFMASTRDLSATACYELPELMLIVLPAATEAAAGYIGAAASVSSINFRT